MNGWTPDRDLESFPDPAGPPSDRSSSGPVDAAPPAAAYHREVIAASFAAAAEAGLLFLPIHLAAERVSGVSGGLLASYPAFLVSFVAGTALATRFRASGRLTTWIAAAALAIGGAQAVASHPLTVTRAGWVLALVLLAAVRVATLALRNWREPVTASFGWGAAALLVEIAAGQNPDLGWRSLLPWVVAVFFVGSLASRAASMRLSAARDVSSPGRWNRLAAVVTAAAAIALALAATVGGSGGLLEGTGRYAIAVIGFVLGALTSALAVLLWPVFWVAQRLHLDLSGLQQALQRLARGARTRTSSRRFSPGPLARTLGLLVLAGLIVLLVLAIRRLRRRVVAPADDEWRTLPDASSLPRSGRLPRLRLRERRALPEQTIRRWYAEALLALERAGLSREPSRTPGEFAREVHDLAPEVGGSFGALTRAYEQVRYGNVEVDQLAIGLLAGERERFLAAVRSVRVRPEDREESAGLTGTDATRP